MENTSMFTDNVELMRIGKGDVIRLQKMLKYMQITSPLEDFMNLKAEMVEQCSSKLKKEFVLKCIDNGNLQPIVKEVEKLYFDKIEDGNLDLSQYLVFGNTENSVYFNLSVLMRQLEKEKCNIYLYQPRGINVELSDVSRETQIDVQNFFNIYASEAFVLALDFGEGFRISMTPVISGGKNGEPLLKISRLSQRCITVETVSIRNAYNIISILELYRG